MKSLITPSILAAVTPARANASPVLQQLASQHVVGDSPSQDSIQAALLGLTDEAKN
jgi:hypothetical protein